MKTLITVLFFLLNAYIIHAQVKISGRILDNTNNAIANCNVLILNAKDSSLIKGTVTNSNGNFTFNVNASTNYLISYSFSSYQTKYQLITFANSEDAIKDVGNIILQNKKIELNDVTVTAKKPFLEQKMDRLVVNVKSNITNAGSTVLDVLQKSPGVLVDKQNSVISMSGKDGVQVMINGKMNYMPASALISMLDGMSANNVEQIELITTPPAKYDAGGNAGYINIILSKSPDKGFNGSYALTAGAFIGYGPSANIDFNYREKKINFYGSLASSNRGTPQTIDNYRKIWNGANTTETQISSDRNTYQFNNNVRLGLDYKINKQTIFGMLVAGYTNHWYMTANNVSTKIVNALPDTSIEIYNVENNRWKHGMTNLNVQHTTKQGNQININVDYLHYYNLNPTNYTNKYYNNTKLFLQKTDLLSSKETNIYIFPVQLDIARKLNKKTNFEYGAKLVQSKFTNNVLVANLVQTNWISDNDYTANALLKENIGAAYSSVAIQANEKNTVKAGLRYEYTTTNLGTITQKNIVDRKYGKFFPTLYFNHKINEKNNITFSYNKRINRPTFNDLAPFIIFFDPNTFVSGNAALQPTIANALKVDYGYKRFIFSIGYKYELNPIGRFQTKVNAITNKQYGIVQNLDYAKGVNALIVLPTHFAKWCNGSLNISANYNQAAASFLTTPVKVEQFSYNLSGFQSFTLSKTISAELSGFYSSKNIFGVAIGNPFGVINIGFAKKFTASSLKFGVDDLLDSNRWQFITDAPKENFYSEIKLHLPRRLCKITYSKTFGNKILKAKRERNTASDEERGRVQ